MDLIRYTLLADGTSDEVLLPIINWLITQHRPAASVAAAFARQVGPASSGLPERVAAALKNFPCDILFVHRDAERMTRADRLREIEDATEGIAVVSVPIIPIRMTEAWLLADEAAIRFAAGNGSGRHPLNLPQRRQWETLPDPKSVLLEALTVANGGTRRARSKFKPERVRMLVTQRSESFAQLRGLAAFDNFEQDLIQQLERL